MSTPSDVRFKTSFTPPITSSVDLRFSAAVRTVASGPNDRLGRITDRGAGRAPFSRKRSTRETRAGPWSLAGWRTFAAAATLVNRIVSAKGAMGESFATSITPTNVNETRRSVYCTSTGSVSVNPARTRS